MKRDAWIILIVSTILTWMLAHGTAMWEEVNTMYRWVIFFSGIIFLLTLLFVLIKYFSEPQKELDFVFIVEPGNKIKIKDILSKKGIKLVWKFTNNTSNKIDTISYIVRTLKDGHLVGNYSWQYTWSITIPPKSKKAHPWEFTDPMGYSIGSKGRGWYEVDCIVEYKFGNGKEDSKHAFVWDRQKVEVI